MWCPEESVEKKNVFTQKCDEIRRFDGIYPILTYVLTKYSIWQRIRLYRQYGRLRQSDDRVFADFHTFLLLEDFFLPYFTF